MVLPLSRRAKVLLNQTNIKGQIILEIDGFDDTAIFGAVDVEKFARIGEDDLTIGEFFIGGTVKNSLSKPRISLDGTQTRVSQQIIPDQGGTSSVQKLTIQMIDKDSELSKLLSPGQVVPDVHGRKARVYAAFQSGSHPEDSVLVLSGIVKSTEFGAGFVRVVIAHPEELKRQTLFPKFENELAAAIDAVQTTITLKNTAGLKLPEDILTTFVVINDEVIQYSGISGNDLTGCTRGAPVQNRPTVAAAHNIDDPVESLYKLQETTIPLSLKLLFSGPEQYFAEDVIVTDFVKYSDAISIANAVIFKTIDDVQSRFGLTEGDKITITGDSNPVNNVTDEPITGFGTFAEGGSYLVLGNAALVESVDTGALGAFESQYRTMTQTGTGCNMSPEQVDVERFLFWEDLFGAAYSEYRFELLDDINAKEFLDTEVFFPNALYSVPRKGRISLHFSIPPLALEDVVVLDISNVTNPEKLKIWRATTKYFYNTIEYSHNFDPIKDKFFRRDIRISQDSLDRIKVGVKKLLIESRGMADDLNATSVITSLSKRVLDRYRFGAQVIKGVQLQYKVGMPLEVSDAVVLDGASLKMTDIGRGDRRFRKRLFEIIDKKWDYGKGTVMVDLLDTSFDINSRVGVMGPSSFIAADSTTTEIRIKRSFTTGEFDLEIEKWTPYVGEKIKIRDDNYDFVEEVTIVQIPTSRNDTLIVSPALSVAPTEDMIVDMPDYSGDSDEKAIWKNIHCFVCPVVDVVSGVDDFSFTVAPADISKFFVGGFCRVHDPDFDVRDSDRQEITDVDTGTNTVTVAKSLGFTPQAGDEARPIGFSDDNGLPYNYL